MGRRRVLHVYKFFRPQFSGEGIFLERLAPVFAGLRPDLDHDVLVTHTPAPDEAPRMSGLAAVHYIAQGPDGASQMQLVIWLLRNGGRYDVVHFHTHIDRTFLGSLSLKLRGNRVVLSATLDDSVPGLMRTYRPAFRPLVRRLFGLIDQFVAISPKLHEETNGYVPADKSVLIPIGIPLPEADADARQSNRRKLGIPQDATVVLSVGGVCARKDQAFLVDRVPALAQSDPNFLLVLVGPILEPDYHARIMAFIAANGLEDRVRFTGYSDTPWDYYAAADLMMFASREEGFGTVMIEAMANGLPILARHLPGVNDVFIKHGENGLLFSSDAEFDDHARALLTEPIGRAALGREAREFVARRFDIRTVAAHYLEVYGAPVSTDGRAMAQALQGAQS